MPFNLKPLRNGLKLSNLGCPLEFISSLQAGRSLFLILQDAGWRRGHEESVDMGTVLKILHSCVLVRSNLVFKHQ